MRAVGYDDEYVVRNTSSEKVAPGFKTKPGPRALINSLREAEGLVVLRTASKGGE
jgi:hypothetical protein